MKTSWFYLIILGGLILFNNARVVSQESETKAEVRNVSAFSGIRVGGVFKVYLEYSDQNYLRLVGKQEFLDKTITEVNNNILEISARSIKNWGKVSIYVGVPSLDYLDVNGAAELECVNTLKAGTIEIHVSGAAEAVVNIEASNINSDISGASRLKLLGSAITHQSTVSGASRLRADEMITEKTEIEISGAAYAKVNAKSELSGNASGSSSISYVGEPQVRNISKTGSASINNYSGDDDYSDEFRDSTKIKIGNLDINVYEGEDSVRIKVGNNTLHVDEDGNVSFSHEKRPRFNGHWSGIDLGVNGYVNRDFAFDYGSGYEYLDLNMAKSMAVNFNFYEKNFNIVKNQLGLVTGLGLECHNYRFDRSVTLLPDSGQIVGYYIYDSNNKSNDLKKSKLVVNYITLPLIFEVQPMNDNNKKSFHFGAGMIFGARIASHTKEVYKSENTEYTLYDQDDIQVGKITSPDDNIIKRHDDFYLNPFKVDATVRLGWGWLNLFGTYSMTTLFRDNKGPELFPYSIGITLSDW